MNRLAIEKEGELTIVTFFWTYMNSLAIAKEGELNMGTFDEHICSIPLGEHAHRICHQEQSRTFAICSVRYNQSSTEDSELHYIRLLDDQTFEFISTYQLDTFEYACSILSCSFSDDSNVYYCAGTAYVLPEVNEPTKVVLTVLILFFNFCFISLNLN
jgi:DNA damage-binding protein 1